MIRRIMSFLAVATLAAATTLTGSMKGPDGTGLNGNLYLSLSQQGALLVGCGGPIQVVPTYEVRIAVSAGSVSGSVYGNDCLNPQGTYYNVRFVDNQGNVLMTDRWILVGSTADVGTIVSAIISGTTQTLGSNGVIIPVSTVTQTVTQSAGTRFNANYLGATNTFYLPDTGTCTNAGCWFVNTVAFINGFATAANTDSVLYIGNGNFYGRTYSGTTANCSGVADGWMALHKGSYQASTITAEMCVDGALYAVTLNKQ
jgi:hypothetical protein